MKSSYIINHYGDLIRSLVSINKPKNIIEIGVLDGFSSLIIASTIKKLKLNSRFDSYDLFESYQFNSSKYDDVSSLIKKFKLSKNINLYSGNFSNIYKNYKINSIDFAHIDISNDGNTIDYFFKYYDKIMKEGSIIIFEGGSIFRDKVIWMKKYKKKKLNQSIYENKIINKKYNFLILDKYPSMTIFYKKFRTYNKNDIKLLNFKSEELLKFGYTNILSFKKRYID